MKGYIFVIKKKIKSINNADSFSQPSLIIFLAMIVCISVWFVWCFCGNDFVVLAGYLNYLDLNGGCHCWDILIHKQIF